MRLIQNFMIILMKARLSNENPVTVAYQWKHSE